MDQPPSSPADLISVLRRELAILEQLRYSHRQLRVLFEAGDSRFLGVALDELSEGMAELELVERHRIAATETLGSALHLPSTPTMKDLIARLPAELGEPLMSLQRELDELLSGVDSDRRRVRTLSHARVAGRTGHRLSG